MSRTPTEILDCLNELRAQLGHESCLEFLAIVQETLPAQTAELAEAIRNWDTVAAARAAHKLRGSVGALGASQIIGIIRELEQRLASDDHATAVSLDREVALSIEVLRTNLADFIEQSGAKSPTT
jgi:HPt (histidine-containing phosphotransfer) domain-containing protein